MVSDSVKTIIKLWYRNKSLRINALKKKCTALTPQVQYNYYYNYEHR